MMTVNKFLLYWRSNKEWYKYDNNGNPYLTDKAPEMAKKSFEQYKEHQKNICN